MSLVRFQFWPLSFFNKYTILLNKPQILWAAKEVLALILHPVYFLTHEDFLVKNNGKIHIKGKKKENFMNIFVVFFGVMASLAGFSSLSALYVDSTPSTSISVDKHGKKHGDFVMLGLGAKSSVYLSNNYYYQPTREKEAKLIRNWKINDPIRVLKTKQDRRYVLANMRTGESIKTRIFSWH